MNYKEMKEMGKMNLVKYAGEYWFTLAEYTNTRDTKGYSDHASIKSAIRTFVVKQSSEKYIAFRGESQIKNVIQENRNNELFDPEDFKGTRLAIIKYDMLEDLNKKFKVAANQSKQFKAFMEAAEKWMASHKPAEADEAEVTGESVTSRAIALRQLRGELTRLDKEIEVRMGNKEKILQAINLLEAMQLEELV
jgi:SpoVK/Ycf46/Vps4 family AAA+-type ATPase